MSVRPDEIADELEKAQRLIDAGSKLSWTEQNREIEKVRSQNLAALKADKRLFIAYLPNGQSMTGTPWQIYQEKARLNYLNSWERMLGTLSNIEGGIGGTIGFALGGEKGAEAGARLFDDPANALGRVPESERGTGNRGTEYQRGAPLAPLPPEGIREVLKEPLRPPTAVDPRLPPEPPAPQNRKPPAPPEVINRKAPPPPPESLERKPEKATANRFGDEGKPREPATPAVPFGSIDLPLEVLPSKQPQPRKAPAKKEKPAPAKAAPTNAAPTNAAPKEEPAPKAPAGATSSKPAGNSATSGANKLVDDVARGLRKPARPAEPAKPAQPAKPAKSAKPAATFDEGFRPEAFPDAARQEHDSAKRLEEHIASELRKFALENKLPEPLQGETFAKIAKKMAEQARKNPRWKVPADIEKTLDKQLQPTRQALLEEAGFGDIINVLRKWNQRRAAEARANLKQVQSRSTPRQRKAMNDLVTDLERIEPLSGYGEEKVPEEDVGSRNDLNEEQKAAYENLKNSLRVQRDLEGTLRAKIARTKPDNLVYAPDLSFSAVVDPTEKLQEPAHQLKLAADREVATRLVEELTKYSDSTVPAPRQTPELHGAFEVLPGGGKNYIPTSLSEIRAQMTELLRSRLSKVNVAEGVTPDVVDAAQKLGTNPGKGP